MEGIITGFVALILFFILMFILVIYLTYKIIQFIVVAINLYKEMVQNQKRIIQLLKMGLPTSIGEERAPQKKCPSCGAQIYSDDKFCENCGTAIS